MRSVVPRSSSVGSQPRLGTRPSGSGPPQHVLNKGRLDGPVSQNTAAFLAKGAGSQEAGQIGRHPIIAAADAARLSPV